ncbi:hypothetical protein CYMTET_27212 [Cymbomonas tetramitiformis]|uniref:LysM domain-containing protein n=1 Tax=Cymbomonas tetramitiformis TaxID=36881 RepID=A0AAE0FRR7_9CHLO|nr:hypothetical protein CYMTET_27212 [Cymbomonas tetramitiformis]
MPFGRRRPNIQTYTVQSGDCLYSISRKHNTSLVAFKEANGIANVDYLRTGQVLTLPEHEAEGVASRILRAVKSDGTLLVNSGDSLSKIATAYGVSELELKRVNKLKSNELTAGQVLTIDHLGGQHGLSSGSTWKALGEPRSFSPAESSAGRALIPLALRPPWAPPDPNSQRSASREGSQVALDGWTLADHATKTLQHTVSSLVQDFCNGKAFLLFTNRLPPLLGQAVCSCRLEVDSMLKGLLHTAGEYAVRGAPLQLEGRPGQSTRTEAEASSESSNALTLQALAQQLLGKPLAERLEPRRKMIQAPPRSGDQAAAQSPPGAPFDAGSSVRLGAGRTADGVVEAARGALLSEAPFALEAAEAGDLVEVTGHARQGNCMTGEPHEVESKRLTEVQQVVREHVSDVFGKLQEALQAAGTSWLGQLVESTTAVQYGAAALLRGAAAEQSRPLRLEAGAGTAGLGGHIGDADPSGHGPLHERSSQGARPSLLLDPPQEAASPAQDVLSLQVTSLAVPVVESVHVGIPTLPDGPGSVLPMPVTSFGGDASPELQGAHKDTGRAEVGDPLATAEMPDMPPVAAASASSPQAFGLGEPEMSISPDGKNRARRTRKPSSYRAGLQLSAGPVAATVASLDLTSLDLTPLDSEALQSASLVAGNTVSPRPFSRGLNASPRHRSVSSIDGSPTKSRASPGQDRGSPGKLRAKKETLEQEELQRLRDARAVAATVEFYELMATEAREAAQGAGAEQASSPAEQPQTSQLAPGECQGKEGEELGAQHCAAEAGASAELAEEGGRLKDRSQRGRVGAPSSTESPSAQPRGAAAGPDMSAAQPRGAAAGPDTSAAQPRGAAAGPDHGQPHNHVEPPQDLTRPDMSAASPCNLEGLKDQRLLKEKQEARVDDSSIPKIQSIEEQMSLLLEEEKTILAERINSPRGRIDSPRGKIDSLRGMNDSPRGKIDSPRGRIDSPRGRIDSPRGKIDSPRGKIDSPPGKIDSPPGKIASPPGKIDFPPGKITSPLGKSASPPGKLDSPPGKITSPRGKITSPRGKSASPPGKSASLRGKDVLEDLGLPSAATEQPQRQSGQEEGYSAAAGRLVDDAVEKSAEDTALLFPGTRVPRAVKVRGEAPQHAASLPIVETQLPSHAVREETATPTCSTSVSSEDYVELRFTPRAETSVDSVAEDELAAGEATTRSPAPSTGSSSSPDAMQVVGSNGSATALVSSGIIIAKVAASQTRDVVTEAAAPLHDKAINSGDVGPDTASVVGEEHDPSSSASHSPRSWFTQELPHLRSTALPLPTKPGEARLATTHKSSSFSSKLRKMGRSIKQKTQASKRLMHGCWLLPGDSR